MYVQRLDKNKHPNNFSDVDKYVISYVLFLQKTSRNRLTGVSEDVIKAEFMIYHLLYIIT